jgi:hypothetical protein
MPKAGRVVWTSDSLTHGLQWFKANVEAELSRELDDFADECEQYMKDNAPWQDRTGDARDGLNAHRYENGDVQGVELAHGVDYGIFLEFKFGGRDAIVIPTLEVMGPRMMEKTNGLLDRVNYQGVGG